MTPHYEWAPVTDPSKLDRKTRYFAKWSEDEGLLVSRFNNWEFLSPGSTGTVAINWPHIQVLVSAPPPDPSEFMRFSEWVALSAWRYFPDHGWTNEYLPLRNGEPLYLSTAALYAKFEAETTD